MNEIKSLEYTSISGSFAIKKKRISHSFSYKVWCFCSSHRSFSFRESMPLPCDSVIQTNQRAERIDSFSFSWIIFLVLFGSQPTRQIAPSQQPGHTSIASTATDSTWNLFAEEHAPTTFTYTRTTLVVSHTSYLLQWHIHTHTHAHTSYKLNDQQY